jgi:hypothetical protein
MRTVLNRSTGRASFILVSAGMVGSVALSVVPVVAHAAGHRPHAGVSWHVATHSHRQVHDSSVVLGPAVAYQRGANGVVHRVR